MEKELTEIGSTSTSLVNNPTFNTKEFFDTLIGYVKSNKKKVSRLAILSLSRVLSDLIPGYSISQHVPSDRLSKVVQARRNFDNLILQTANTFISIVEKIALGKNVFIKNRIFASRALATLFCQKPHFNTASQLARISVKLACNSIEEIREPQCQAIRSILQSDASFTTSLSIFSNISKLKISEISLDLLDSLQSFKVRDIEKTETIETTDRELLHDLKEADLINDKSHLEKNQSLILEHLFGLMFRFLKETKSESHFLHAMECIRIFVGRINFDLVAPIITALKGNRFSLRAAITATQTAFVLCEKSQFFVDLKDFFQVVYARSFEALEQREALIEYLALFDIISKTFDTSRRHSFAKRLVSMCLHASNDVATAFICQIRMFFTQYPELTSAVDFEYDAQGKFDIESDDPDFCYGPAAKYWELAELCFSPYQELREFALEIVEIKDNEALTNADIRAARNKIVFNPGKLLEDLDDSMRIFDVTKLEIGRVPLPETFKIYNFDK